MQMLVTIDQKKELSKIANESTIITECVREQQNITILLVIYIILVTEFLVIITAKCLWNLI